MGWCVNISLRQAAGNKHSQPSGQLQGNLCIIEVWLGSFFIKQPQTHLQPSKPVTQCKMTMEYSRLTPKRHNMHGCIDGSSRGADDRYKAKSMSASVTSPASQASYRKWQSAMPKGTNLDDCISISCQCSLWRSSSVLVQATPNTWR